MSKFVCSKIEPQKINGRIGSFFGHSLAPLGDIDQDGYNDFAIGSPYDESGKVYIYRGNGSFPLESQIMKHCFENIKYKNEFCF